MNRWKGRAVLAAFALTLVACGGDDNDYRLDSETVNLNLNATTEVAEAGRLEFPRLRQDGSSMVVVHTTHKYGVNYSIEWDFTKKSQRWSCYQMYAENSVSNTSRYTGTPQYPSDPDIPSTYQFASDPYWNTGFDHGHICPSADRLCSSEANYQTFFLTNMQPQVNGFNSGVWSNMELRLRNWNRNSFRDTLYVCKGGTIDNASQILRTLKNGLIVPKYFFMAVLCIKDQEYKAIGFWVEHEDNDDDDLRKYAVSIDELEELTGIDFFCNLPDATEKAVESNVYPQSWGLK